MECTTLTYRLCHPPLRSIRHRLERWRRTALQPALPINAFAYSNIQARWSFALYTNKIRLFDERMRYTRYHAPVDV